MVYTFKELNIGIDAWIKEQTHNAPDKDYVIDWLGKQVHNIGNGLMLSDPIIKTQAFKIIYHQYQIGAFYFTDGLFDGDGIFDLLTVRERKTILKTNLNFLLPHRLFSEDTYNHDETNEVVIKKAIFQAFTKLIAYLEIKKKVELYFEKNQKEITKNHSTNNNTTLQYALFHYYKQAGNHEPLFEKKGNTTKRKAMVEQGDKYGVGGDAFANTYYSIQYGKEKERISKKNIPHIKVVIEWLEKFEEGKKIASKELKSAEILP